MSDETEPKGTGIDRFDRQTYPFSPVRYSIRERGDGCAILLGIVAAGILTTAYVIAVPQRGRWYEELVNVAVLGAALILSWGLFGGLFRLLRWSKQPTPDNQAGEVARILVGILERADRRRRAPSLGASHDRIMAFLAENPDQPWSPEIRRLMDEVDRRVRDYPEPPKGISARAMIESVEDELRDLRLFAREPPFTPSVGILFVLGTIALLLWVAVGLLL